MYLQLTTRVHQKYFTKQRVAVNTNSAVPERSIWITCNQHTWTWTTSVCVNDSTEHSDDAVEQWTRIHQQCLCRHMNNQLSITSMYVINCSTSYLNFTQQSYHTLWLIHIFRIIRCSRPQVLTAVVKNKYIQYLPSTLYHFTYCHR